MGLFERKEKRCRRCQQAAQVLQRVEVYEHRRGRSPFQKPPFEWICGQCQEPTIQEKLEAFLDRGLVTPPSPPWNAYQAWPLHDMVEMNFKPQDVELLRRLLPRQASACERCGGQGRFHLADTSLFRNPKKSAFNGFQEPQERLQVRCAHCMAQYLAQALKQDILWISSYCPAGAIASCCPGRSDYSLAPPQSVTPRSENPACQTTPRICQRSVRKVRETAPTGKPGFSLTHRTAFSSFPFKNPRGGMLARLD